MEFVIRRITLLKFRCPYVSVPFCVRSWIIKTEPNNEVSVKFSTGSTWLSTNYPNSSCTDETKAVCSELLTSILIRHQLHNTCSYCSICDFRLQEPEASFLSRLCFSIPLMTIGTWIRSAKTMRRTTLSFASQIFVWFHVNIQRRRLPVVFFHVVIQPCVTYAADRTPLRGLFWGAVTKFCPDGIQTTKLHGTADPWLELWPEWTTHSSFVCLCT